MAAWTVPPAKEPTKTQDDFLRERTAKVSWLADRGYLVSERIRNALLKVRREDFIPHEYRDYAYREVPLPLPGVQSTISCPHSYPLFYEPLGLDEAHRFLEVGTGSGYGAAVAREVVGADGLVVSVEIDPVTFEFAKRNLRNAGYDDIALVNADGGLGYPEMGPYNRIAVTAVSVEIPRPLIEQLVCGGKVIGPVRRRHTQDLVLIERRRQGLERRAICQVAYVPLRGRYGVYGQ
jgi:protein-L-isoaspartate(D-aspartate) O-methyltransferase